MFIIKSTDAFASLFQNALSLDFPQQGVKDLCQLVDLLSYEIVGNNKVRLGPKPTPESFVEMRKVIASYIEKEKPIPFMVPWGSEKPDGSGIDLAEISALKTLKSLQARVQAHYEPGLQFNIRIEDVSAPHLFFYRQEEARLEAARYTEGFLKLVKILGLNFIKPKPESHAVSEEEFNEDADLVLESMIPYLNSIIAGTKDEKAITRMAELGWTSNLTIETVQDYLTSYDKLYPGWTVGEKTHTLARYFSGALTRSRLKIRGEDVEWEGNFLDLSFVQAAHGTASKFPKRVYYRTCPTDITSFHCPPWRAKGYFKISEDGSQACTKLSSYSSIPEGLHKSELVIGNGKIETTVNGDYLL